MLDEIPRDDPFDSTPPRADSMGVRDAWRAARAQPRRVAAIAGALAVAAVAAWWVLRPPPPTRPEALLPVVTVGAGANASPSASTAPTVASTVVVHVAGAVARPGVLHLPAGARVVDAVEAAGGATLEADTDRVNLAAPLADGARIQVPRLGEQVVAAPDGGAAAAPSSSEPVDLNHADASQLEALPGIGPATAAAIVEHRERHGPFATVDALGDVPGIGDAKLAQLRDLVRV